MDTNYAGPTTTATSEQEGRLKVDTKGMKKKIIKKYLKKMHTEDKGKKGYEDHSDLMGIKPYSNIGPGRSTDEAKVVEKLKMKRAKGSTSKSGGKANVGEVSKAIGSFVNK